MIYVTVNTPYPFFHILTSKNMQILTTKYTEKQISSVYGTYIYNPFIFIL